MFRWIADINENESLVRVLPTNVVYIRGGGRGGHISQPGEISFPGGRVEDGETFQEAAIRETCEELNLVPNQIDIRGEIGYLIHQGRTIHCFVGKIKIENWEYIHPNEEVYRLFTVEVDT